MIDLYSPRNHNYDANGDMVIFPTSGTLHPILGDAWSLEMIVPIDDEGRWEYVVEEAVVRVPSWDGSKQLYRINNIIKTDDEISVQGYPIAFDARDDVFFIDVRAKNKTCAEAGSILFGSTDYRVESDIKDKRNAYYVYKNGLEAVNGSGPGLAARWGGEILYDNKTFHILKQVGRDQGFEIRYGKNLAGFEYSVDMSEVITRVYPKAYNGRTPTFYFVDSPLLNTYAKRYVQTKVYEDIILKSDIDEGMDVSGFTVCENQSELNVALDEAVKADFEAGLDKPIVEIYADLIDLSHTKEYANIKELETVSLGDTVRCRNTRLGITTKARVKELIWDFINQRLESVVLGDYRETYFQRINSKVDSSEALITNSVSELSARIVAADTKIDSNQATTDAGLDQKLAKNSSISSAFVESLFGDEPQEAKANTYLNEASTKILVTKLLEKMGG